MHDVEQYLENHKRRTLRVAVARVPSIDLAEKEVIYLLGGSLCIIFLFCCRVCAHKRQHTKQL